MEQIRFHFINNFVLFILIFFTDLPEQIFTHRKTVKDNGDPVL